MIDGSSELDRAAPPEAVRRSIDGSSELPRAAPPKATVWRRALAVAALISAAGTLWIVARTGSVRRVELVPDPARRAAATALSPPRRAHDDARAIVSGVVTSTDGGAPVPDAVVVLIAGGTELATPVGADGRFSLAVAPGTYEVLVRAPMHASIALPERDRLPVPPDAVLAGRVDRQLLPRLVLDRGSGDAELALDVAPLHVLGLEVVAMSGRPIAGAVVRARGEARPVIGSDVAITDDRGHASLRVPSGTYTIDVAHADHVGAEPGPSVDVDRTSDLRVVLREGCVIEGRVRAPDGRPSGDGAIERRFGPTERQFGPATRVTADGRFRYATLDVGDVTLRAWPWHAHPSAPQTFACTAGARFRGVELVVADLEPDLEGTVVDENGVEVAFAEVSLVPLSPSGIGQQEMTDHRGRVRIFRVPEGPYQLVVHDGTRIATQTVTAPDRALSLVSRAPGRVLGGVRGAHATSLELVFVACEEGPRELQPIGSVRSLVPVRDGRFVIDRVPACALRGAARWRGQTIPVRVEVPAGSDAVLELELDPAPLKDIAGVVLGHDGKVIASATVTVAAIGHSGRPVRTDRRGRFALRAPSGARLVATSGRRVAEGRVSDANVTREHVEIVLQ